MKSKKSHNELYNNNNERFRWLERNNFDNNQEYAEKVLKNFNICKYHFFYDRYGNLSLLIENNLKKYKIVVDDSDLVFRIYRCDVHNNFKKYTKENMVLKKIIKNDCIYNSIKWISNNSKID